MLRIIRKGVDTIFVRIILGIIAISFVGFGGVSLMSGNSRGNAITFKDAKNISVEEFQRAKHMRIDEIQTRAGVNLTEQQIKTMGIDMMVVRDFVTKAMIDYLGDKYDLDADDEYVIERVKKMPVFHNESGVFDVEIFKNTLRRVRKAEDEFFDNIKDELIHGSLANVFLHSFPVPKMMSDNIIGFMSETKIIDIYKIDLNAESSDFEKKEPDDEMVAKIYDTNPSAFSVPEMRNFKLLSFSNEFLDRGLNLTDEDFQKFFEDNPEDFEEKTYEKAAPKVKEILTKMKREDAMLDLIKELEDDIAAGLNIEEISKKYNLVAENMEGRTKESLLSEEQGEYAEFADQLFEMVESEVSYPIEIKDKDELVIFEVSQINPTRIQALDEVKLIIADLWKIEQLKEHNLNRFLQFKSDYSELLEGDAVNLAEKRKQFIDAKILQQKSIAITSDFKTNRQDALAENQYPPELMKSIFSTRQGDNTRVVTKDSEAFFAFIKKEYIDTKKADEIKASRYNEYVATIRDSIMDEIIAYLIDKNETQINLK